MEKEKIAALSIRVSSADQQNSLESQEARLREFCAYQKIKVYAVLIDEDTSGGIPIYKRKDGAKLEQLIKDKKINCIVAAKADRLFRNTVDAITTVEMWNKQNIALHLLDMGGQIVDTSSAAGKMIFTILITFSEFERKRTGERTKDVLGFKKKNKQTYSKSPYGFEIKGRVISPEGKVISPGELIPVPEQQEAIELMKSLKAKDESLRSIAKQLSLLNFKPSNGGKWQPSSIKQILDNELHA